MEAYHRQWPFGSRGTFIKNLFDCKGLKLQLLYYASILRRSSGGGRVGLMVLTEFNFIYHKSAATVVAELSFFFLSYD